MFSGWHFGKHFLLGIGEKIQTLPNAFFLLWGALVSSELYVKISSESLISYLLIKNIGIFLIVNAC